MPGSQGSGPGLVGVSSGRRQSRTAAMSPAVLRSRPAAAVSRWRSGCLQFRPPTREVGSQGRPSRLVGEPGDVLVGLVELCDGLGSEELFGGDVEAVGVALDRLESRAAGLLSSRSEVLAETGASSRARICCSVSVGVRDVVGRQPDGQLAASAVELTTCTGQRSASVRSGSPSVRVARWNSPRSTRCAGTPKPSAPTCEWRSRSAT